MFATSLSEAVSPSLPSTINRMTSAISTASSACSLICESITSFVFVSIPPLSINANLIPHHSASAYILSLVTPGVSSTMDTLRPTILLKNVDLPTLGLPTTATIGLLIKNSSYEFLWVKYLQVIHTLSDADKLNCQVKFICNSYYNTTFCGTIKFCQYYSCQTGDFPKLFRLRDSIFTGSCIKHK